MKDMMSEIPPPQKKIKVEKDKISVASIDGCWSWVMGTWMSVVLCFCVCVQIFTIKKTHTLKTKK